MGCDLQGIDTNILIVFFQYGLPMPISLLRADNNLPPWRPGLKEVILIFPVHCSRLPIIFSLYTVVKEVTLIVRVSAPPTPPKF